jgi:hypothetical protein
MNVNPKMNCKIRYLRDSEKMDFNFTFKTPAMISDSAVSGAVSIYPNVSFIFRCIISEPAR